jgi:hypothetical protein
MTLPELIAAYDQRARRIQSDAEPLSTEECAQTGLALGRFLPDTVDVTAPATLERLSGLVRRIVCLTEAAGIGQEPGIPWEHTPAGDWESFLGRIANQFALDPMIPLEWLAAQLVTPPVAPPAPYGPDNPRFVWVIGAIREQFPDIPEYCECGGALRLYDRKHRQTVATVHHTYAQAMVLETITEPGDAPFTALADWLNCLTPETLASENLPV